MRKNLYLYWQNLHNMTLFITIDKMKFHEWFTSQKLWGTILFQLSCLQRRHACDDGYELW